MSAMYADAEGGAASASRAPFTPPASLAVVQVGEVAPPSVMLDKLRSYPQLFRRVEAIPALGDGVYARPRAYGDSDEAMRAQVRALRGMAGSLGAEYLLLVGGTVDQTDSASPLSFLNLTIIGAFIVPSHQTRAVMKASGALIDVRTGQLTAISSAEVEVSQIAPLASAQGDIQKRLDAKRAELTVHLAESVAQDCGRIGSDVPIRPMTSELPLKRDASLDAYAPASLTPPNPSSSDFTPSSSFSPDRNFRLQGH